jgi:hypothetical protein
MSRFKFRTLQLTQTVAILVALVVVSGFSFKF